MRQKLHPIAIAAAAALAAASSSDRPDRDRIAMVDTAKIILLLGALAGFGTRHSTSAVTIQTLGSGSAVSVVERIATFDALTANNTSELGNYSEGGLYITTGNQSRGADPPLAAKLDPFHGATAPDRGFFCVAWDNPEWTSLPTTNLALMHAIDLSA